MQVSLSSPVSSTFSFFHSSLNRLQQLVMAIWLKIRTYLGLSPPTFKYAFAQQSNPDCHLRMWANFQRMQTLRARDPDGKLVLRESDFQRHSYWLGKGNSDFSKWLEAMKHPQITQYRDEGIKEAPCYPNLYTQNGKNYFSSSYNPFEHSDRQVFAPFFLKKSKISELSYMLPLFEEKGRYFCFDESVQDYTPVSYNRSGQELIPADFVFSPGQMRSLPPHFLTLKLTKVSGKRNYIKAFDPDLAVKGFFPRHLGTYKLLLLTLGLDSRNYPIDNDHPESAVTHALQTEMHQKGCSWDSAICKKEHLIEYALAELFKKDTELFEKTKKHVDFYFKTYSRYEKELHLLKDENGVPFSEKNLDRYMPGKEQMLAYCLMKNVQYLWFAAMGSNAFCDHLGIPKIARFIPLFPGPSRYSQAAYQQHNKDSFITVWKEVLTHLRHHYPDKQDWASFSGHGMVVSFDPELIRVQNEKNISNKSLAQDLKIAGINSLHGKEMDPFYRIC